MSPKARKLATVAGIAAVAVAAVLLARAPWSGDGSESRLRASGTVEATEGHLGFQASGRIASIQVEEGDPVRAGDTLAELDRREILARLAATEAQVAEARARLRELERGYRSEEVEQGRAAEATARHRLEDAERDLERTRRLFEGGAVSREALDKAQTAWEVARSEARRAREGMRLLEAGPRTETIQAQRARLEAAEASRWAIDAVLDQMVVTAPFDGLVTVRHREPGEIVSPGAPVLTLMDENDRWVRIYVREDRMGAVKLGQSARVTSDTWPERGYEGRVRFIAARAEFTPKNVQTTEERVKLVYAVKVRITGDPELQRKPGMRADVEIDLAARSEGPEAGAGSE
ncbi:MAG: HlyD family efflux transporter periplasmic adaptor subunit [Gemmatimonadota bacterium]